MAATSFAKSRTGSRIYCQRHPEAARQLILRIQTAVGQLAEFPFMGRVGRVEATRELVISNTSYLIIYRVKEESVEILRILHSSRKYPENSV